MNMVQELKKKKQKKKIDFQNLQENCLMREMKLLVFLKKEFFRIKEMYLKQKKKKNQKKTNQKKFFKYIEDESKSISYELFEKHFNFVSPTVLAKQLYETKI